MEVPQSKCYRLLNHGPTVIVSTQTVDQHGADPLMNAMTAAWNLVVDFPNTTRGAKIGVVLDKVSKTRDMIVESGLFAVQIPCLRQMALANALGTMTLHSDADKLKNAGAEMFYLDTSKSTGVVDGDDNAAAAATARIPLVGGCVGYFLCRLIVNEHNQNEHDLFIGEVLSAWADSRVFRDGRWLYDNTEESRQMRTLHHIAGGNYFVLGDMVSCESTLPE